MRMRHIPLILLLLSGCSSVGVNRPTSLPDFKPVEAPSQAGIQKGVSIVVKDAKLQQPVEISAVRKTDHGPGSYYVCLREMNASAERSRNIYSVFFDNEDFKGSRLSVIMDDCEHQFYSPIQIVTTGSDKS